MGLAEGDYHMDLENETTRSYIGIWTQKILWAAIYKCQSEGGERSKI